MTVGALNVDPPSARVVETASSALARIRAYLRRDPAEPSEIRITVPDEPASSVGVAVPREIAILFASVLAHLAEGRAVIVTAADVELSSQQAAKMLNVSRPYLIGLLDAGLIRYRMVGSHRRINVRSLLEYKEADDRRTRRAADELTALEEELGLT